MKHVDLDVAAVTRLLHSDAKDLLVLKQTFFTLRHPSSVVDEPLPRNPFPEVGEVIYVRESHVFATAEEAYSLYGIDYDKQRTEPRRSDNAVVYEAGWDDPGWSIVWRAPEQMPEWASRFRLKVVSIYKREEQVGPHVETVYKAYFAKEGDI